MIAAGATCLSISAGKTLIFDRQVMLALADRHNICVIGSPIETFSDNEA